MSKFKKEEIQTWRQEKSKPKTEEQFKWQWQSYIFSGIFKISTYGSEQPP
jgi:hypothetical protein